MQHLLHKLLILIIFLPSAALAIHSEDPLQDPALEAKAEELFKQLRCVTCDSQSIYESRAPLAGDMRLAVREQLVAGQTPQAIKDYMRQRYGESILLAPPTDGINAGLWIMPFIMLMAGILIVGGIALQQRKASSS